MHANLMRSNHRGLLYSENKVSSPRFFLSCVVVQIKNFCIVARNELNKASFFFNSETRFNERKMCKLYKNDASLSEPGWMPYNVWLRRMTNIYHRANAALWAIIAN